MSPTEKTVPELVRRPAGPASPHAPPTADQIVCFCRQVPHGTVASAIEDGDATSLADIQTQTMACTRCFGCRFDLERMLEEKLGSAYVRTEMVSLPREAEPSRRSRLRQRVGGSKDQPVPTLPRRMYVPVLEGFKGFDVRTRVILFNARDEHERQSGRARRVPLRVDLLAPDGTRLAASEIAVEPGHSAVLDVRDIAPEGGLPDGMGALKLVVDAEALGSLRPYYHFISPTGITSTHEKAAPMGAQATRDRPRSYYWTFPVGYSAQPQHAYMFLTATQPFPLDRHELVWQSEEGERARAPLPRLELDQSACVALHEHFPAVAAGFVGGTVHLEPNHGVPAGFMIRFAPERDLWRVQHL